MNTAAREFFNLSKHHAIQKLDQLSDSLVSKFDDFLLKTTNNERTAQTIIEDPYLRVHFFLLLLVTSLKYSLFWKT